MHGVLRSLPLHRAKLKGDADTAWYHCALPVRLATRYPCLTTALKCIRKRHVSSPDSGVALLRRAIVQVSALLNFVDTLQSNASYACMRMTPSHYLGFHTGPVVASEWAARTTLRPH